MLNFSKAKIFLVITTCILAIFFSLPNFIKFDDDSIFNNKLNLGLDLRGGSHLLLEVDFDYYLHEQLNILKNEIKDEFKNQRVRSLPKIKENNISFFSVDENDIKQIKKIIHKIDKNLQITKEPEEGNYLVSYDSTKINQIKKELVTQSIAIVRRRIDETGTKEPVIQAQGNNRILLQVPGAKNPEEIKRLLGKTAKLTFHFIIDSQKIHPLDNSVSKLSDRQGNYYTIKNKVILSGDLLNDADPTYFEGKPAVSFRFNNKGARKFSKITKENIGKVLAIVLDGQVVTAPRINSAIREGNGIISGSFDVKEANEVALLLRAGALPAPLHILEERTVGPSLGSDSIEAGSIASIIGLILVAMFMVYYYKIFGIFANLALIVNIAIIVATLSLIGATLTLPGIAGIVLTIGIAVDANVLIFERIKEEIKLQKNIFSAVEEGFAKAFKTILDSNITTLIVAFILFLLGSGPIKGFAVTLCIGIVASMFSAILLTRMAIIFYLKTRPNINVN